MEVLLDHITTYVDVGDLGEWLGRYRRAGFVVGDRYVAHAHGIRSGSVQLGSEYLEHLVVEDWDAFAKAPANDKLVCAAGRPFAIAFKARDLHATHAAWSRNGIALDAIEVLRASDRATGEPLAWSLFAIPLKALRGASCIVVERDEAARDESPNGVYALAGVTFVSDEVAERVAQWRRFFTESQPGVFALGRHDVQWSSPDAYREQYAHTWQPARHPLGELGVVHLVCDDIDRTCAALTAAEWTYTTAPCGAVFVEPLAEGGFPLAIHAYPRGARLKLP